MLAVTVSGTSRGVARIGIGALTGSDGASAVVFEFLTSLAWAIGVDVGFPLVEDKLSSAMRLCLSRKTCTA